MSFGLKKVRATTARYVLDTCSIDPQRPIAMTVCYADTPQLRSARLKVAREGGPRGGYEYLARLTARGGLVTGWENVTEGGTPAPSDIETVERFLLELCAPPPEGYGEIVAGLWAFVNDPNNFRELVQTAEQLGNG